ncbi:MAG: hypothetical protein VCB26_01785 [Candidatus Hydrogenedentota bacterium]|jgi:hypothetical protein
MAEQSMYKRMKQVGFIDNMALRTLLVLPLIKKRGTHPSILIPMHAASRPNANG